MPDNGTDINFNTVTESKLSVLSIFTGSKSTLWDKFDSVCSICKIVYVWGGTISLEDKDQFIIKLDFLAHY